MADVARDHLTASARRAIVQLLGTDDLASISTWADEIRNDRPETYRWHFVDIPWDASGFDEARDCYRPSRRGSISGTDRHNCVVDRILEFRAVLANQGASSSQRLEALKFLVHFVADIHQPLHAVGKARGGNDVLVVEFGSAQCGSRACNLHEAWDLGLIHHAHLSQQEYVRRLEQSVVRNLASNEQIDPKHWANESFRLAHEVWLSEEGSIDENYYRRNLPLLEQQLARAGLRLAALLNNALTTGN